MNLKTIKKEMSGKYKNYIFFTVIGIIFLFTRLYRITSLPEGMHIDEVSMGYNTWSLVNFGTDRYGESWPVYFDNAGSGQSCLYVYLAVILSKLLGGYSVLSLRLVAVFFGTLLLIFGTKIAYELNGIVCAKAMSVIITIMPFFIMSERWAFDCNALLPIFVMAFYFFVRLLRTKDKRYAILSGIFFAFSLYSYILAFIIVPVFLIFALTYAIITKHISIKNFIYFTVSGIVCSIPICLYVFVILGILQPFHIGPVSITAASAGRLSELAWQGYSIPELFGQLCNLLTYDKYTFTADKKYGTFYLNNLYLFGFKFSLMQILVFGCILTLISICIYRIVKKKSCLEILAVFYLIASLVPMFFLKQFAIYRFNATFFVFAFTLAYVYATLWKKGAVVVCGIFCTLFLFNFCDYNSYLFQGKFAEEHAALDYFDKELIDIFETMDFSKYDAVYVDDTATYNTGLTVMYGMRVEPKDAVQNTKNMDEDGMIYKNIHIGIPEEVEDGAVYIIRDVNADTSYYTNSYEQMDLYKRLVQNNKIKEELENADCKYEIKDNYYIFYN